MANKNNSVQFCFESINAFRSRRLLRFLRKASANCFSLSIERSNPFLFKRGFFFFVGLIIQIIRGCYFFSAIEIVEGQDQLVTFSVC